jgi:deazaflavin-dependent oxidoreductase (nitroreductase family)
MARWQWFGRIHCAAYRATGGKLGGRLAGRDMLLLTTRGRRSGELRTTPLSYLVDADDLVVVASNNGEPRNPAWWLNLLADPAAELQVGRERYAVVAHRAVGEECDRLWPLLVAYNPPYATYAKRTTRAIPVVVLQRPREACPDSPRPA